MDSKIWLHHIAKLRYAPSSANQTLKSPAAFSVCNRSMLGGSDRSFDACHSNQTDDDRTSRAKQSASSKCNIPFISVFGWRILGKTRETGTMHPHEPHMRDEHMVKVIIDQPASPRQRVGRALSIQNSIMIHYSTLLGTNPARWGWNMTYYWIPWA